MEESGKLQSMGSQRVGHDFTFHFSLSLWCWERLKVGGEGDDRGWDGWIASPSQWTWVWVTPAVGGGQGGLACCDPWGHKESDANVRPDWTALSFLAIWCIAGKQLEL